MTSIRELASHLRRVKGRPPGPNTEAVLVNGRILKTSAEENVSFSEVAGIM